MSKVIANIKATFMKLKKSKKFYYFLGLFIVLISLTAIYFSYAHYYDDSTSGTIFNGTAFINSPDVTLYIYRETRDSSGDGTGEYEQIYFIPKSDYTFDHYTCSNGVSSIRFINYKFAVSTTKRASCKVYFTADDVDYKITVDDDNTVQPNIIFRLYIEQTQAQGDFIELGKIPNNGKNYLINAENTISHSPNCCVDSSCSNISIDNSKRQIAISATGDISCNIYLDIE